MQHNLTWQRIESGIWAVFCEDARIGTLTRVETALSNLGKSKQASNTYGLLWSISPDGADLSEEDAREVRWEIKRMKTNRRTAAAYLVEAYGEAGVALPRPPADSLAA